MPRLRGDLVPDPDRAAGQNVGAQAATMNERPKQARPGKLLEVPARLGKPPPDTRHLPDSELPADKGVERDSPGDDVPPRIGPRQADLVEYVGFHQCELVTVTGRAERPDTAFVSVAVEAPSRQRADGIHALHRALRCRCDEDRGDGAASGYRPVRRLGRETEIERREHPPGNDPDV